MFLCWLQVSLFFVTVYQSHLNGYLVAILEINFVEFIFRSSILLIILFNISEQNIHMRGQ